MKVDSAIIDLDGTVYLRDTLIPGAERGISALRAAGIDVVFVSNNPTKSQREYVERLEALGIKASTDSIVTSGSVTREYLTENHGDEQLFVVGDPGLLRQLDHLDITTEPKDADVVVGSIDRSFTYETLTRAARAFLENDPFFVGTDPDRLIPVGDGAFEPGSGAIAGSIAATVDREPDLVLGKPSEQTAQAVLERVGGSPERCFVVGDRLDTDIALGERIGAQTVLVRTGAHDENDIGPGDPQPDHVIDTLEDVTSLLA